MLDDRLLEQRGGSLRQGCVKVHSGLPSNKCHHGVAGSTSAFQADRTGSNPVGDSSRGVVHLCNILSGLPGGHRVSSYGWLAQLDRVGAYEAPGHRFESCTTLQIPKLTERRVKYRDEKGPSPSAGPNPKGRGAAHYSSWPELQDLKLESWVRDERLAGAAKTGSYGRFAKLVWQRSRKPTWRSAMVSWGFESSIFRH